MIVLGITGSIASGKSTVSDVFAEAGMPVFDADDTVHRFYGSPPQGLVEAFPSAMAESGEIDRRKLSAMLENDPSILPRLEAFTHPHVVGEANDFLAKLAVDPPAIAVLDVPLLYESGLADLCDRVLVTSAPRAMRDARIADRAGMSPMLRGALEARQLSDDEKLVRADYVVDTTRSRDEVARAIRDIIAELFHLDSR